MDSLESRFRPVAGLLVFQAAGLIVCLCAYVTLGIQLTGGLPLGVSLTALLLLLWKMTYARTATDGFLASALIISWATIIILAQYPALVWGRPLVDAALVSADRAMGVDAVAVNQWMRQHRWLVIALDVSYWTFLWQQFAVVGLLALRRDRAGIWEYVSLYHICLGIGVVGCALWPASEPYAYLGFAPLAPQESGVVQIAAYHAGLRVVNVNVLAGLVSFPSCHVAMACIFLWSLRRGPSSWWALALVLNVMLVSSTILLGIHYAADVVGGFALFGITLAIYHRAPFFQPLSFASFLEWKLAMRRMFAGR